MEHFWHSTKTILFQSVPIRGDLQLEKILLCSTKNVPENHFLIHTCIGHCTEVMPSYLGLLVLYY